MLKRDLVVIGGGAAGFFGAIRFAELQKNARVSILEKSARTLDKVRISGGGRCNVTHGCFEPTELAKHYPRGQRELLGPFHTFMCGDMMEWLENRGVPTKIEEDGRVFPVSDQSSSIIDCFLRQTKVMNIEVKTNEGVVSLERLNGGWRVESTSSIYETPAVLIATGSSKVAWQLLSKLGMTIVSPVPSLFTFNTTAPLFKGLMGLSLNHAKVKVCGSELSAEGPLLITHWGLSGPAILRLSAWGARVLADQNYRFQIEINFAGENDPRSWCDDRRLDDRKKLIKSTFFPGIPRRLWERMVLLLGIEQKNWSDLSKQEQKSLIAMLTAYRPDVNGKSTFKDEFVTAGGVSLDEINFKTMEHKLHSGLYFAGEVLNIDAITGGFNFQAAWTTSWIAAEAIHTNSHSAPR